MSSSILAVVKRKPGRPVKYVNAEDYMKKRKKYLKDYNMRDNAKSARKKYNDKKAKQKRTSNIQNALTHDKELLKECIKHVLQNDPKYINMLQDLCREAEQKNNTMSDDDQSNVI